MVVAVVAAAAATRFTAGRRPPGRLGRIARVGFLFALVVGVVAVQRIRVRPGYSPVAIGVGAAFGGTGCRRRPCRRPPAPYQRAPDPDASREKYDTNQRSPQQQQQAHPLRLSSQSSSDSTGSLPVETFQSGTTPSSTPPLTAIRHNAPINSRSSSSSSNCVPSSSPRNDENRWLVSRRTALVSTVVSSVASCLYSTPTTTAAAAATDRIFYPTNNSPLATTATATNIDCLRDLPPFDPATTVRLYLCRHGETEYNRLHLMQGVRLATVPLNETGRRQAVRLGQALARARVPPELILHSPLERAQSTAQLAALQQQQQQSAFAQSPLGSAAAEASSAVVQRRSHSWSGYSNYYHPPSPPLSSRSSSIAGDDTNTNNDNPFPRFSNNNDKNRRHRYWTRPLASLAEVDFGGAAEGRPVTAGQRAALTALYTAWASGNLDVRLSSINGKEEDDDDDDKEEDLGPLHLFNTNNNNNVEGESGRQILQRIDNAVQSMVEKAAFTTTSGCLAAVSHSSYLRLLLGAIQGFDASFSPTMPLANCCINVVDFARPLRRRRRRRQSVLLPWKKKTDSYDDDTYTSIIDRLSSGRIIRLNEVRHLL